MVFTLSTSLAYLGILAGVFLPTVTASVTCRNVTIPVTATTENLQMINLPDPTDAAAHAEYFLNALLAVPPNNGTVSVSGTYSISATYCKPFLGVGIPDRKVIQVMISGATYNKEMWTGFNKSPIYNWHTYATSAGYHTLAMDRLGGGQSQRPDPFQIVQTQLEVEIIDQIISSLKTPGGIPSAKIPSFSSSKGGKVVYIGHSLGSTLGNHLSLKYPSDIYAYILTGFSSTFSPPIAFLFDMFPAATLGIPCLEGLPYGYITSRTESIRTKTFYAGAGGYDTKLAKADYAEYRDTYTIGEGSTGVAMVRVPNYTGRVFLATGELDALFCDGSGAGVGAGAGNSSYEICKGILEKTRGDLYPNVTENKFGWHVARNTGHSLGLHYSAPVTIVNVLRWLGDQGL